MSKIPIKNMQGKQVGEYEVADGLLVYDKGMAAVHEAVIQYRNNQRTGTASTKTRSEVRCTGSKPWRQKGLGRARSGTKASPIWRGGGVAFGPHPRDFGGRMQKKVARLAFRRAFSEKVAAGAVEMLEELSFQEPKTRLMKAVMNSLGAEKSTLFIVAGADENLLLAVRNLPKTSVCTAENVCTYDLMRYASIYVTQEGMEKLKTRLVPPAGRSER